MKKYKNIRDFFEEYKARGGVARKLYLIVREKTGVSTVSAERWFKMESQTHNDLYLSALEEITGIDRSNLFRR